MPAKHYLLSVFSYVCDQAIEVGLEEGKDPSLFMKSIEDAPCDDVLLEGVTGLSVRANMEHVTSTFTWTKKLNTISTSSKVTEMAKRRVRYEKSWHWIWLNQRVASLYETRQGTRRNCAEQALQEYQLKLHNSYALSYTTAIRLRRQLQFTSMLREAGFSIIVVLGRKKLEQAIRDTAITPEDLIAWAKLTLPLIERQMARARLVS